MRERGVDGFILPRTDEFQGEFLAAYAQRFAWLTGFIGSAGIAAILPETACVLSDGRYTIQLKQEVDQNFFETGNSIETPIEAWILRYAQSGAKIAYDPWLHTPQQITRMRDALAQEGVELCALEGGNPVDHLWHDQPPRPTAQAFLFPDDVAGKTSAQKRDDLCKAMISQGLDALIIGEADSVCWLLNVRGGDVDYTPLILSYAVLYADGTLDWFVGRDKVSATITDALGQGVRIFDFADLKSRLGTLSEKNIGMDFSATPSGFEALLHSASLIDLKDPCSHPRSIKTQAEQSAIRDAHIRDARALDAFLNWLEEAQKKDAPLSELSVAEHLEKFRARDPAYRGESFPAICGFAENGAIIHYRSSEKSNKVIAGNSLLLVDSGGQYQWGTTDITRTIAIGAPSHDMRLHYTLVLKGHIAVSMARFPKGTTGAQIDVLARAALWQEGLDYAHGTGHGVGCYLGVHEAAANISPRSHAPLEAGMLLSNEPGYYKEEAYGIRIENLLLVIEDGICHDTGKEMLAFETVTFARYDDRLIMHEMLSASERAWLDAYARRVSEAIA